MIHLDTNFAVRALLSGTPGQRRLTAWEAGGQAIRISAPAWAEFLCGPVPQADVAFMAALLGPAVGFGGPEAVLAAELFNLGGRRRGSMSDCMIAAVCLHHGATLATNNAADFARFAPRGLRLRAP